MHKIKAHNICKCLNPDWIAVIIKYKDMRLKIKNYMIEPTQPLDVNTLQNIHLDEELIRLPVVLDAEIIVNSHTNKDLKWHISSQYLQDCFSNTL